MSNFNFAMNSQKGREAVVNSTIVKSVEALENLALTAKDGQKCYLDDGGRSGNFIMRTSRKNENDGGTIHNGMERDLAVDVIKAEWFGVVCDGRDNTTILQKLIDSENAKWLENDRNYITREIVVPVGDCAVGNLHISGGVRMDVKGRFVPIDTTTTMVYLSGSCIKIKTIILDGSYMNGYNGIPMQVDTTNPTTLKMLDKDYWKAPMYNTIDTLNIKGGYTTSTVGLKVLVNGKGMSWFRINNFEIRDCVTGIDITTTNGGYVTSNVISGRINNCNNSFIAKGVVSANDFNFHIQPKSISGVTGITIEGNSNRFYGVIWDWDNSYGLALKDTGDNNCYSSGFLPSNFKEHISYSSLTTDIGTKYENIDTMNALYQWSGSARNGLGFQDNLLANLTTYGDVIIRKDGEEYNPATKYKMFTQPTAINYYQSISWSGDDGAGEITLDMIFSLSRIHTIGVGFGLKSRICSNIKIEFSNGGDTWYVFEEYENNYNIVYLATTRGGEGYDMDRIKITFQNGIDATDANNPTAPLSNLLAIQSIVAFGVGKRQAFLDKVSNTEYAFTPVSDTLQVNSFFLDESDDTLKFKDSTGAIKTISFD